MTTPTVPAAGPVRLTDTSAVAFRPARAVRVTGGLWAGRRRVNREVCVPDGWPRLRQAGNLHNLELAAGLAEGEYVNQLPFLDSDVHKWLEGVAWTLADPQLGPDAAERLRALAAEATTLLAAAQQPDGYLDSHFQVRFPGRRWFDLANGHELYCAGHLFQAAVAMHRSTGDAALLELARRFADLVSDTFGTGEGRLDGICGHPEVETALVELFRETGERRYLQTAAYFVDARGRGLVGQVGFGARYFQDHLPVREAPRVVGHAVRQLYLLAGMADVAAETADDGLLAATVRLWEEMTAGQVYLTGGVGAHHRDEAFGDPYELPSERSYCETCAAIASVQLAWRLLMATGEARYADLLERTLYNAFLGGLSLDGRRYIYANPLQVRDDHSHDGGDGDYERKPWFSCACCPPNVMRLLGSLEHYVALSDAGTVLLHQYLPGRVEVEVAGGVAALTVQTGYPWDGAVAVGIDAAPGGTWTLALRVPQWAVGATLTLDGQPVPEPPVDGWWRLTRAWTGGEQLLLSLPVVPRLTAADPRVDAVRGALAVERGPLVYCVEGADHPGLRLDDLVLVTDVAPTDGEPDAELADAVRVHATAHVRRRSAAGWWPYRDAGAGSAQPGGSQGPGGSAEPAEPVRLTLVPYFTWGNRASGPMRVFLPVV